VLLATAAACGLFLWAQRDPATVVTGADGSEAMLVPSGTFTMGDDEDAPLREIYLDAFYIDRHEVTTARYARFLAATGSMRPPDGWEAVDTAVHGQLPVTGVDWNEAAAYCRWARRRLPTEAEWEKAARGADQRRFPWGNEEATLERANHANASPETYEGGLQPVGSLPRGASPYGVHELAGNAAEWVADWHADAVERGDVRNPRGPPAGTSRVIRGGGRFDPAYRVAATKRYHASPDTRLPDLGFRCARDAG
jgi:formylglycine-generating enzyme required for sulfatase activity